MVDRLAVAFLIGALLLLLRQVVIFVSMFVGT